MCHPSPLPAAESASAITPRCAEVETRVLSNRPVNGEYRLLELDAPRSVLDCQPGQFFQLLCPEPTGEHPFLRRPMSIYGYDAETGVLQFLYKVTGAGTRGLATLTPGDVLNVLGPLGQGFTIRDDWQRLLLVARGVGLATLAPLARAAQLKGRALTAICSARSPELAMSRDLFLSYGAEVIVVSDSDGSSSVEAIRALIEGQIATRGVDAFYTCGSARLVRLLQDIGAKHGIPGEVAMEQQMACGLGMCQACVRSFRSDAGKVHLRVCRDGPVFSIAEAIV